MEIHQIKRHSDAFQQPVNENDLRFKLNQELLGEKILNVTELNAGLFNNTFRVNTSHQTYILKVAPAKNADVFYNEHNLMQRERSVAQQLQSVSPLIPNYLSFFTVDNRNAFLQPFVEGRLWHDVIPTLSDLENAILWKQLGAFANELHSCCGDEFGYPAPFKRFNRWSQFIVNNVEGMVEDCKRLHVFCEEIEVYLRYLPHCVKLLDQLKSPKLLHGDLWPRNVIIEGNGSDIHLKAVIDGERAFWGDPVSDWVLLLYGVPDEFWQGYGNNLLKTTNPAHIAIYKGMYFILNILEAVRFQDSDITPRQNLSAVNQTLRDCLNK
jgi:aminoglycoside phosphotransferase (APT) family kinase protein